MKKHLFLLIFFFLVNGPVVFANPVDSLFLSAYQLLDSDFDAAISEVERFKVGIGSYSESDQHDFYHQAAFFYATIGDFVNEANHWQSKIELLAPASDTLQKTRYRLGRAYLNSAQWDLAMDEFEKFENFAIYMADTLQVAAAYDGMASVLMSTGRSDEAVTYYLKAIRILESANDIMKLAQVHSNLAVLYVDLGDYDKAFNARKMAYDLALQSGDAYAIHKAEYGLGSSYNDLQKSDSAIFHLKRAETYFETSFNVRFLNGVYNGMGRAYMDIGDFDKAEEYYNKAIDLLRDIGYDFGLAGTLTNYGMVLYGAGKHKEGARACQEALPIAKEMGAPNLELSICQCLYENYKANRQPDSALAYYELQNLLEDSLVNVETQKSILQQELESGYSKEKESIISNANEVIKEEVSLRNFWIAGAFILFGALLILFWAFRQKKKSAELVKDEKQYLDNLLHNLVHEFRTPLTLIKGPTEELLRNDSENKLLMMVNKNSDQMLNLVNQVLDFAKIKAGRLAITNEVMNLSLFYADTLALFQPLAGEKGIKLINQSTISNSFIEGDADKLFKILSNLLTNAIKYSNDKAVVSLRSNLEGNQLVFSVQDTGIGISEADQKQVFHKFYQVDATITRKGEGTGLGLAFVQELVHLMGGTINLESEVNLGTKVTVNVPVNVVGENKTQSTTIENTYHPTINLEKPVDLDPESDRKQILIIEDNRDLQSFLKQILTEQGYQIHSALDGEAGVKMAEEVIPDLVISDVMMPKMDGYQVVEKLKGTFSTEHIPIIILTAKASFDSMLDGLSAGADDYLSKPFKSQELQLRIANQIKRQERLHAKYAENANQEIQPEVKDALIEKIEILLMADLSEQISVENLADKCALSRSQLHRKVKFLTGLSTTALLTSMRLNLSLKDLKSTNLSISEIAYKYGYSDPAHYSKLFKKQFSQTPSDYRNS